MYIQQLFEALLVYVKGMQHLYVYEIEVDIKKKANDRMNI